MAHIKTQLNSLYYGFPVALLTSWDQKTGTTNITPVSSVWSLSDQVVLGISQNSKCFDNLQNTPELVLNVPDRQLWTQVEAIAKTTGKKSLPEYKKKRGYHYCSNKFELGGFTADHSLFVKPEKIKECGIQVELAVNKINSRTDFAIIEAQVLTSYVDSCLLDGQHIAHAKWHPIFYKFREYCTDNQSLGFNFRFNEH